MQVSHVQTRRPRSVPADHVSGGGSVGATVPHVRQTIAAPRAGTAGAGTVGDTVGSVT
jgi:hypothetical protein